MKLIGAFLCFRHQRVVVNGIKSVWHRLCQASHRAPFLGPLLSEIRLFATVFAIIKLRIRLQKDNDR